VRAFYIVLGILIGVFIAGQFSTSDVESAIESNNMVEVKEIQPIKLPPVGTREEPEEATPAVEPAEEEDTEDADRETVLTDRERKEQAYSQYLEDGDALHFCQELVKTMKLQTLLDLPAHELVAAVEFYDIEYGDLCADKTYESESYSEMLTRLFATIEAKEDQNQ